MNRCQHCRKPLRAGLTLHPHCVTPAATVAAMNAAYAAQRKRSRVIVRAKDRRRRARVDLNYDVLPRMIVLQTDWHAPVFDLPVAAVLRVACAVYLAPSYSTFVAARIAFMESGTIKL